MVFTSRRVSDADTDLSRSRLSRLSRLRATTEGAGWVPLAAGPPEPQPAREPGADPPVVDPPVVDPHSVDRPISDPPGADPPPGEPVGVRKLGAELPGADLPGHVGAIAQHRSARTSRWERLRRAALARAVAAMPRDLAVARLDPRWRGVLAVAVAVLLAVVVTAVVVWRARPTSEPVATGAAPVLSRAPDPAPTGASGRPSTVVVDVTGTVRRPGLVHMAAGSRVDDAIRAAGGAATGADLSGLNLARKVVDGEQIVVGQPAGPAAAPGAGSAPAPGSAATGSGAKVDLNTATVTDLDTLPGVGPVLAQRIIDYRAAHNGFRTVDQLREVQGIGDARFRDLSPLVTV